MNHHKVIGTSFQDSSLKTVKKTNKIVWVDGQNNRCKVLDHFLTKMILFYASTEWYELY